MYYIFYQNYDDMEAHSFNTKDELVKYLELYKIKHQLDYEEDVYIIKGDRIKLPTNTQETL